MNKSQLIPVSLSLIIALLLFLIIEALVARNAECSFAARAILPEKAGFPITLAGDIVVPHDPITNQPSGRLLDVIPSLSSHSNRLGVTMFFPWADDETLREFVFRDIQDRESTWIGSLNVSKDRKRCNNSWRLPIISNVRCHDDVFHSFSVGAAIPFGVNSNKNVGSIDTLRMSKLEPENNYLENGHHNNENGGIRNPRRWLLRLVICLSCSLVGVCLLFVYGIRGIFWAIVGWAMILSAFVLGYLDKFPFTWRWPI